MKIHASIKTAWNTQTLSQALPKALPKPLAQTLAKIILWALIVENPFSNLAWTLWSFEWNIFKLTVYSNTGVIKKISLQKLWIKYVFGLSMLWWITTLKTFLLCHVKIVIYVTGHFVFCSAGGQGSELTNDNFCHYTGLLMKSQLRWTLL